MNNRIGYALTAALLITIVVMAVGFSYLQNEINGLKPQTPTSTPNSPTPTNPPSTTANPTPTSSSSTGPAPSSVLYSTVVFEWYLKPEIRNNQTWLDGAMNNNYNASKTWSQNYIDYMNSFWEIPQGLVNSDMGVLAKAAFVQNVPVHTTYAETTGFTKVSYQYAEDGGEPLYYVLEGFLPTIADSRNWTKDFV